MSGTNPNEFNLDFDELSEEESDGFDDMSILPDAPKIGGKGYDADIYGSKARHHGGQPTTPPLFAQASSFPDVTQLRVWKVENGTPTSLGTISAESGEDSFVKHFFAAMPQIGEGSCRYNLRPLGINGNEIGGQFSLTINENHSVLQKMRKFNSRNADGGHPQYMHGGGFSGLPEGFLGVMEKTLEANQRALDLERERTAELMAHMAQERIDLASNTASSVQMVTERMMESDSRRQEQHQEQESLRHEQMQQAMASFFENNLEVLKQNQDKEREGNNLAKEREQNFFQTLLQDSQARMEREVQRSKEERERDREAHQRQLEIDRDRRIREREEQDRRWERELQRIELQRSREKEEFERKERERMRTLESQRDKERIEAKEREKERERQHTYRMEQARIQAQQDKEYQERMMQVQALSLQSDKSQSFKEVLASTFETISGLGIDPQDLLSKMFGKESSSEGGDTLSNIAKIATTAGEVIKSQQEQSALQSQMYAHQAQQAQQEEHQRRYLLQQHQQAQQEAMEQQGEGAQGIPALHRPDPIEEEPIVEPQPTSNLPLSRQKDARVALRRLVGTLTRAPKEKWENFITVAITSEPAIYEYINDVSVVYAITEAGANDEFLTAIVEELKKSELVPNDLNYGDIK